MTEVTAEMIERGRGADPKVAAERRRLAIKIREAREKLTSTETGHRAFDVQLLQLFAEGRKSSGLVMLAFTLAIATTTTAWIPARSQRDLADPDLHRPCSILSLGGEVSPQPLGRYEHRPLAA